MTLQPAIADIAAPNDSEINGNSISTLSIDGFVTTKFASVGSEVHIHAHTMGHSDNSIVSADIVQYDIDPLDSMINSMFPGQGSFVDRVVLQSTGVHENDSSIMTWQGSYMIPVSSTGGVFGARIFVEDGNRFAVDDPTQLREVFRGEFEKVLGAIDTAWDTANPMGEIAGEFEELETKGTSNGGWSNFVAVATDGDGAGGSRQLWNTMLNAGHNQYNMSAGSNFLEALMIMLDSEDADAGLKFVIGLMTYLDNLPLPRTFYDFEDLAEYVQTYDAIENFTRFEGTGDFEAAYNALIGSNEWNNLSSALDNLANGTKPFESAQTLMRNIALLAVSDHPQAMIEGLTAWAEPLFNQDFENMTPFQKFVLRFAEMAGELDWETDAQDIDGDEIPDIIRWQYEYLLDTTEGQAWTARMESDAPWVNDAFDDFNTLPEDIIEHIFTAMDDPILETTGEVLQEFGSWMNNATRADIEDKWPKYDEDDEENDGENSQSVEPVIFSEYYPMQTTEFDSHLLEVGIVLEFEAGGDCEGHNSPNWDDEVITISMTNERGFQVSTEMTKMENGRYIALLLAPELESTSWSLSQPLQQYDSCDISYARIEIDRSLRPSMLESMTIENNDEIFMVSAVGVLVDQPETAQVGESYTVTSQTYDSTGIISDAEADIAILRISPQLGASAIESLSPEGENNIVLNYPDSLYGEYSGQDLEGDLTIKIMPMGEHNGDDESRNHPQSYEFESIELTSNGVYWNASNYLPNDRGVVDLVISGSTSNGIEFTEMMQIPLPGSLGCASTEANADGTNVNVGYNYKNFQSDDENFYKPDLEQVKVSWGDGSETIYPVNEWEENPSGWDSHSYENSGEYFIEVEYKDENGRSHYQNLRYDTEQGFWKDSDDGGYWAGWVEGSPCWLKSEENSVPTPEIIDSFITDGPFEVITEQVMDVDENGLASLSFEPNHPGVYLSIVQSKGTLENGEIKTGIGLNFAYITNGEILISGLEKVTTFAGLPVYIADSANNGLNTITVTPEDIEYSNFNVTIGVAAIKIDVAFPDIDWDSIEESEDFELEFQSGDTSRNQELRFEAPMSLLGIAILNPEEKIMAEAIHFGIVLKDPGQLDMMGALGPGQTTNVALNSGDGEASRIFAVAAPKLGFDPASIDFASFTSLIYEGIREDVGWAFENEKSVRICEEIYSNSWYEGNGIELEISLSQEYENDYRRGTILDPVDTSNTRLLDTNGDEIEPQNDWVEDEGYERYSMNARFTVSEGEYYLHSGTEFNTEFRIEVYGENDDHERNCNSEQEVSEQDAFDLFDDFFSDVNSIAWGIGSSADLTLPHLASPTSNYTVLAMVQQGEGSSATIHAAIGSQIAEPNPEPLTMKDLNIDYLPENPAAGDTILITVTEEQTGIPVEMLSVIMLEDGFTIDSDLTDSNGQTAFVLQEGTFLIRASGGLYNATEFTITVTSTGSEEEETQDSDNDDIPDSLDLDDDNDGVDDTFDQCPGTPSGVSVDNDGCPEESLVPGCTYPDASNYNPEANIDDGNCEFASVISGCTNPDATNYNLDATDDDGSCNLSNDNEKEPTADSSENKILGMSPLILGTIIAVLIFAILGAVLFIRNGGSNDDNDWYQQDMMFEQEAHKQVPEVTSTSRPRGPPPSHQGYMQDGYEVSEYPAGSGNWWWKDPQTGQWKEWS